MENSNDINKEYKTDAKRIDNKINDNNDKLKSQINQIDKSIDSIERQKKQLNNIKDSFMEINQISNKMTELLSLSIKGRGVSAELDEISAKNSKRMRNLTEQFDEDFKKMKNTIDDLYAKKDKIQKELYNNNNDNNNAKKDNM